MIKTFCRVFHVPLSNIGVQQLGFVLHDPWPQNTGHDAHTCAEALSLSASAARAAAVAAAASFSTLSISLVSSSALSNSSSSQASTTCCSSSATRAAASNKKEDAELRKLTVNSQARAKQVLRFASLFPPLALANAAGLVHQPCF